MEEVRLGTIGSGVIVRSFLDGVKNTEGIRLAAVYSRRRETAEELAAAYGPAAVYTDMAAFLEDETVNTVYIASPNLLHVPQAEAALKAGKHVISEKPLCPRAAEGRKLAALAEERGLLYVDATPTACLPNFEVVRRLLPRLGRVRLVMGSYSQYSSRYDALLRGELPNVFNPAFGGGALMDINYYNVWLTAALFGKPEEVRYTANLRDGIDTSGILVLRYGDFAAQLTGAKDTWGVNFYQIEGETGYLYVEGGSNGLASVRFAEKGREETLLNEQDGTDRMEYEARGLSRLFRDGDRAELRRRLDTALCAAEILETARKTAGIVFPGDGENG